MRTRLGGSNLGAEIWAVLLRILPRTPPTWPPGIPPGTPPTTPPIAGGGADSSLIISIFFGIAVGVRREPLFSKSVSRTTRTGAAAGGGGGGGGGGGATRNVSNCPFGNTSVNIKGTRTRMPSKKLCTMNENTVVKVFRPRSLELFSSRLSEKSALG